MSNSPSPRADSGFKRTVRMTSVRKVIPLRASNTPNTPNTSTPQGDDATVLEKEPLTKKPRKFKVIFHNDDYTTRDFVVEALMLYFGKDESEATYIMLSVHYKGTGVAGIYPKDIAESKVDTVTKHARSQGFPLKVTAEPE